MSIQTDIDFNNPLDFTFDNNKIDISAGSAKLKPSAVSGNYQNDFSSDVDFVYDNTRAEFAAGRLQQVDKRPANSTFYASFNTNENGNWGNGVLTGTLFGGAAVSGGSLDLRGGILKYADYSPVNNIAATQQGCIRIKWTPNYNGSPASSQNIVDVSNGIDNNNRMAIGHASTGEIFFALFDAVGVSIYVSNFYGAFAAVAGTEYEFEANWDITAGSTRFFIDGTQFGATKIDVGVFSLAGQIVMRLGSTAALTSFADCQINEVLIFSTVQHVADYVPDWTNIYETIYLTNFVEVPEYEKIGIGGIISIDSFSIDDTNARYVIQVAQSGNYLYWDGLAWVISNLSYAQANNEADFNTNIGSITITGEIYIQLGIVFDNTNTQGYCDDLDLLLTVDGVYPVDNPTILVNSSWYIDELINFLQTATIAGSDNITYVIGGKYWNGTAWVDSNNTYLQSNTIAQIQANLATFTTEQLLFSILIFLHSDAGLTTPVMSLISVTYSYGGEPQDIIETCTVWFYADNTDNTICDHTYRARLNTDNVQYKNNIIICQTNIDAVPNINTGYTELELVENVNMVKTGYTTLYYDIFKVKNGLEKKFCRISVPQLADSVLWDIVI